MYTFEYDEIRDYYAGKRVWAEFAEGGETVLSIAEGLLPAQARWTTGLWALVTVDAFRFFRSGRKEGEYHVKVSSAVTDFRMEWFYTDDAVRNGLMEIVEQAHAAE